MSPATPIKLTLAERHILEDAYCVRVQREHGDITSNARRCAASFAEFAECLRPLEARGFLDRAVGITDAGLAALAEAGHELPTLEQLRALSVTIETPRRGRRAA